MGGLLWSLKSLAVPLPTGLYLGLLVDGSHTNDLKLSTVWPYSVLPPAVATTNPLETNNHYKFGGGGGGQFGYRARCFRVEGEVLYASNKLSNLSSAVTTGNTTTAFSLQNNTIAGIPHAAGHAVNEFALLNIYYDFRNSNASEGAFLPYVGVGIAMAALKCYRFEDATTLSGTQEKLLHTGGAVQGIAGLTYEMDSNVSLFLDVRYLASANLQKSTSTAPTTKSQLATVNLGLNFMLLDTTYS